MTKKQQTPEPAQERGTGAGGCSGPLDYDAKAEGPDRVAITMLFLSCSMTAEDALNFGARIMSEARQAQYLASSATNAPRERTAVAGTLDGVVGNSGGEA